MFLALEFVFLSLLAGGMWTLLVATRRFNISQRAMTISFAATALGWMGFLLTTIALLVYATTQLS
ncbi:hypothetical protein ACP8Y2_01255 [Herpetosiphon llansteffanensis]